MGPSPVFSTLSVHLPYTCCVAAINSSANPPRIMPFHALTYIDTHSCLGFVPGKVLPFFLVSAHMLPPLQCFL